MELIEDDSINEQFDVTKNILDVSSFFNVINKNDFKLPGKNLKIPDQNKIFILKDNEIDNSNSNNNDLVNSSSPLMDDFIISDKNAEKVNDESLNEGHHVLNQIQIIEQQDKSTENHNLLVENQQEANQNQQEANNNLLNDNQIQFIESQNPLDHNQIQLTETKEQSTENDLRVLVNDNKKTNENITNEKYANEIVETPTVNEPLLVDSDKNTIQNYNIEKLTESIYNKIKDPRYHLNDIFRQTVEKKNQSFSIKNETSKLIEMNSVEYCFTLNDFFKSKYFLCQKVDPALMSFVSITVSTVFDIFNTFDFEPHEINDFKKSLSNIAYSLFESTLETIFSNNEYNLLKKFLYGTIQLSAVFVEYQKKAVKLKNKNKNDSYKQNELTIKNDKETKLHLNSSSNRILPYKRKFSQQNNLPLINSNFDSDSDESNEINSKRNKTAEINRNSVTEENSNNSADELLKFKQKKNIQKINN